MATSIKELSDIEYDKRRKFKALGMVNTKGKTEQENKDLQSSYMQAKSDWLCAKRNLDNAVEI